MSIIWIGVLSVWVGRNGGLASDRVDDTELDYGRRVNGTTVSWRRVINKVSKQEGEGLAPNAAHAGLLWLLSDFEVILSVGGSNMSGCGWEDSGRVILRTACLCH